MKRFLLIVSAIMFTGAWAAAQSTAEEYAARYNSQVKNFGYSGLGVESILRRWSEAFPTDPDMIEGLFNYHFDKSVSSQVVAKQGKKKFMGQDPVLSMKDSTGTDVNWFQEDFFDEAELGEALSALDYGIELYPTDLYFRLTKVNALIRYEKEYPGLAYEELYRCIDKQSKKGTKWTARGLDIDEDTFASLMQDYCQTFFTIGSPEALMYMFKVAELMHKQRPDDVQFLNDIGAYWLVAEKKPKKAEKFFNKVIAIDPVNQVAHANLRYIRKQAEKKKNSK